MHAAVLFLALGNPADDALAVFKAHCASCHSPQAKKVKGKFADVLDLDKMAADPKRLAKLAQLVREGDMPPEDEPPLTVAEKAAVKAWVESVQTGGAGAGLEVVRAPASPTFWEWLGNFHVLLVHFPIALAIVGALAELWSMRWWAPWHEKGSPPEVVSFCMAGAALFVIPTGLLGWLHAAYGSGAAQPVAREWHRWLGMGSALLLAFTALLLEMDASWGKRGAFTRVMIFVSALVVGLAGHFGGMLTHGADFLEW